MKTQSLKSLFLIFSAVIATVVCAIVITFFQLHRATDALDIAHDDAYQDYLLADELRQSSDDLTRLARTYVVSGDEQWEKQYWEVLDIRNGKKARPLEYHRIYWDFRAAGNNEPRGRGDTVSLQDLMKRAGFSDEEFAKLREAQTNSDDLVRTETIAMNLVKGLRDDGTGKYTVKGEPDLEKARALMHDANYHAYKAKIMKPVDEFFELLDQRTRGAISEAQNRLDFWRNVLSVLIAVLPIFFGFAMWLLYRQLQRQLGGEPASVAQIVRAIATGDMRTEVPVQAGDQTSLLAALRDLRQSLVAALSNVSSAANQIKVASSEIAQGNNDLSNRTEQQASNLEETAASMEQFTVSVKSNADAAHEASSYVQNASIVAQRGGEVVGQVVHTMNEIEASSRKINDIIGVIDGIAFQTNILALNAAVEAARAGEQGRGFAVVASEVRNLAQRSATAAKEIKGLIQESVSKVGEGSRLVDDAGKTMADIVKSVRSVTEIMGRITHATHEQSSGISQVNEAVGQLDQMTQQNAALVEQASAAASTLQNQAVGLVDAVSFFKIDLSTGSNFSFATASASGHAPNYQAPSSKAALKRPVLKPAAKAVEIAKATEARPEPKAESKLAAAAAPKSAAPKAISDDDWEEF